MRKLQAALFVVLGRLASIELLVIPSTGLVMITRKHEQSWLLQSSLEFGVTEGYVELPIVTEKCHTQKGT